MTNLHFHGSTVPFDSGSIIEIFVRRCLFSFSSMMFEELQKLYKQFESYREGQPYEFMNAKIKVEHWAEDLAQNIENETLKHTHTSIRHRIEGVKAPKFYQKHLLSSINDSLAHKDISSINLLHQYFDYNVCFVDRLTHSKPFYSVKIH